MSASRLLLTVLVLAAFAVGMTVPEPEPVAWEYKIVNGLDVGATKDPLLLVKHTKFATDLLNRNAADGWELQQVLGSAGVFRRPKAD